MKRQQVRPRPTGTIVTPADIRTISEVIDLRRWLLEQATPAPFRDT